MPLSFSVTANSNENYCVQRKSGADGHIAMTNLESVSGEGVSGMRQRAGMMRFTANAMLRLSNRNAPVGLSRTARQFLFS